MRACFTLLTLPAFLMLSARDPSRARFVLLRAARSCVVPAGAFVSSTRSSASVAATRSSSRTQGLYFALVALLFRSRRVAADGRSCSASTTLWTTLPVARRPHTREVLSGLLGISSEEIERLERAGVI